jgi:hypothetical protein
VISFSVERLLPPHHVAKPFVSLGPMVLHYDGDDTGQRRALTGEQMVINR